MKTSNSAQRRILPGSLSQKGILIVGLPITLELLFLGLITVENHNLELLSKRESHYRRLLSDCSVMSFIAIDAFNDLQKLITIRNPEDLESIKDKLSALDSALTGVQEEASIESSNQKACKEVLATAHDLRTTFDRAREILCKKLDLDSACELYELKDHLNKLVPRFVEQQQDLCKKAMNLTNDSTRLQIKSRAKERNWIVAAALTSAAIAVWLGSIFSKEILSRLTVIRNNTILLKTKEELNPPVGGHDEIRELDEAFRDMAKALKEAKDKEHELYAMIAHDIRSPLMAVRLTIDFVLSKPELQDSLKTYLLRSCRGLERVTELIGDLLDIEKISAGKFEIFAEKLSSETLIISSLDAAMGLIEEKKLKLITEIEDLSFMGDRDLLKRVIANLLSNAIKFSPANGELKVALQRQQACLRFSVKDEGPGIPEDYQDKIFQQFVQTPDSRAQSKTRSTGLGLAICKMVVEEHDGKIGVISKLGEGSEFWFSIPIPLD